MRRILSLARDQRGVAMLEFALVMPLIAIVLIGALGYAQYFLLAHGAQQIANDAARATVAGLTSAERLTLAQGSVARARTRMPELARYPITTALTEDADSVDVAVRLDATTMPLARATIVAMPDPVIVRHAIVRRGGVE